MPEKKSFEKRDAQEASEGKKTIETRVPEERFQTQQQVDDTASAEALKVNPTGFEKKKTSTKGSALKQEVAATVVTRGVGGDVPGDNAGSTLTLSYSGNEGTILGSAAYTPIVANTQRSGSRYGKKLDDTTKKINFVASEQVEEEYTESKALAENPEAVQGYNGSPRNTNARAQKVVGGAPAELLFTRSIDEIKRDQLYFAEGQTLNGDRFAQTPTLTTTVENGIVNTEAEYNISPRSNYLHKALRIRFNENGALTQFVFDVEDLSCIGAGMTTPYGTDVENRATSHDLIDANYAEMDRQIMDDKAGDEKTNEWSPLPRAVREPTNTVGYLRDMEAITGSEIFMAYKKTTLAYAYQLNRSAKDGMKTRSPMVEALMGLIIDEDSSVNTHSFDPFTQAAYRSGAASLFLAINDSVTKYRTKADVLTAPRSIKLALQTADNSINPFRVKAEFVQCVNDREVFSTIDRDYDPLSPVCISDREMLVHCYNFNDLYSFSSLHNGKPVFAHAPFKYGYSDVRNSYTVDVKLPLLAGLVDYLNANGRAFVRQCGTEEITIPMVHSTCFFSLWDLLVLAATPFMALQRINSMRDVLYYQKNFEYPFHQLITIKDANPMNGVNYGLTDYTKPIEVKRMSPSAAITWYMPELFWPFDEKTADDAYSYVLPWYFSEAEFNFTATHAELCPEHAAISIPSIRSGARWAFLDDLMSMDERDVRLCLDRLVAIPVTTDGEGNQGVYKYSQNADGVPYVTMTAANFSVLEYLRLPRELGDFCVLPYAVARPVTGFTTANGGTAPVYRDFSSGMFGESSYMAKWWHGRRALAGTRGTILQPVTINVERSSAYRQDWDASQACLPTGDETRDDGFIFSLNDAFNADRTPAENKGLMMPFTDGVYNAHVGGQTAATDTAVFGVITLQKALWTRLQKLPFAISPWDMCPHRRAAGEDAAKVDPYDFLYYFGLAGFKASDYAEDVYNRSLMVINQGFSFLRDPWVMASPIFKDSLASTQSANPAALSN